MMWLHVTFVTLAVIILCADANSLKKHSHGPLVDVWANLFRMTTGEDVAWAYMGIPKCSAESGWQCTPGLTNSKCFQGLKDICNGVIECKCETSSPDCFDDESDQACETKEQVEWLMINGLPRFGYGNKDYELFQVFWLLGLTDSLDCQASTGNIVSVRGLSCPDQPTTCITIDQFCDGVEHCANLCYSMWGYQFCGTNTVFGGCLVKDMVKSIEGGVVERKRRDLIENEEETFQ
ncbi:uncharacterized protein LOC144446792 [Glandiceps talaboti]